MIKPVEWLTPNKTIVVLSVLLSIWFAWGNVLHFDAIAYLMSAQALNEQSFQAAMQIYNWPFYSILIASVQRMTYLSYEYSAYVLNAVFYMGCFFSFISILRALGASRRVEWAALILLFIHPEINHFREMIVRDIGYWFGVLVSIYALIQFDKNPSKRLALLWCGAAIWAFLFRLEAVVLLGGVAILWALLRMNVPWKNRVRSFFLLISPLLVLSVLLLFYLLIFSPDMLQTALKDLRVLTVWQKFIAPVTERFLGFRESVAQGSAFPLKTQAWNNILLGGLLLYFLFSVFEVLQVALIGLMLVCVSLKLLPNRSWQHSVLISYGVMLCLIPLFFLYIYFFVSSRYVFPLLWVFLIPLSFGLSALWLKVQDQATWRYGLAGLGIYLIIAGTFSFGTNKSYIKEAGLWIKENVPSTATVEANDKVLLYYSGHADIEKADYRVYSLSRREKDVANELEEALGEPLATFGNRKGDIAVVFEGKASGSPHPSPLP